MEILKETDFKNLGEKKVGKVRDIYIQPDKIILVSTDRHSSFDRIIAHIPHKGAVLNQISAFWFKETKDIVPNHLLEVPDPNVVVARKCSPLPIEMVVRGFITGVTGTSLWTNYEKGQRDFGNFTLPDGMKKNERLQTPVLTPTTKSDEHDRPITPKEIVAEGLLSQELWDKVANIALALFKRGQEIADQRGLILVDTKYEFGLDENGEVVLIDEIHTPDSSRYWMKETYESRFNEGKEPEFFDKEFLRLWFKDNCDPYNDPVLPEAPHELVRELSRRYIEIYERITGETFKKEEGNILERIESNLKKYNVA
ncbi:MAG TPA: phosphoribosylaminoimidazolesuccinocarboxamide synthase [Candidatus Paceibacterota bacterium]|nr:phosphoribosylaminoimidazolesuccinocarboxamide synthase [Candidatus Paceibacterota bacterium]